MLKFELSKEMVEVIGRCLQAGPYAQVAPVIEEVQRQIDAQVTQRQEANREGETK
jgi:hypothetical protein